MQLTHESIGQVMQTPLISVIMNCYNGEKYLREAIDSVLAQTYTNWEIIFWDNQSIDKSAEIVKSYSDPRIKYFYAPIHTSLGEARNLAMEKTQGEWIGFLDTDDEWLPEKLEVQMSRYNNEPEKEKIGIIYSGMKEEFVDENNIIVDLTLENKCGYLFKENLLAYKIFIPTALIMNSAIMNLKLKFDNVFNIVEDFDYFMKITFHYYALEISEPLALYRIHKTSLSFKRSDLWFKEHFILLRKLKKDYNLDSSYDSALKVFYSNFMNHILKHWENEVIICGKYSEYLEVFKSIENKNIKSYFLYFISIHLIPIFWAKKMARVVDRIEHILSK